MHVFLGVKYELFYVIDVFFRVMAVFSAARGKLFCVMDQFSCVRAGLTTVMAEFFSEMVNFIWHITKFRW